MRSTARDSGPASGRGNRAGRWRISSDDQPPVFAFRSAVERPRRLLKPFSVQNGYYTSATRDQLFLFQLADRLGDASTTYGKHDREELVCQHELVGLDPVVS